MTCWDVDQLAAIFAKFPENQLPTVYAVHAALPHEVAGWVPALKIHIHAIHDIHTLLAVPVQTYNDISSQSDHRNWYHQKQCSLPKQRESNEQILNNFHTELLVDRLLVRGKIRLPKVEHPESEGHVTLNKDEYQKSVHLRLRFRYCLGVS